MAALSRPLFYALDVSRVDLVSLVFGARVQPPVDTIDFADEAGGDQDRQLALPFLPGMDAVLVDDASLRFRVGGKQLDITRFTVSPGPGGQGIVLKLPSPGRLLKVDLTYVPPAGQAVRLIVRPVQDGGFGPPILSAPDFEPAGQTYGRTLTGMSIAPAPGSRTVATMPNLLGSAWLLQLATGKDPTQIKVDDQPSDLVPVAVAPTVNRVVIAAAPRNLSVVLKGPPDTPLWSNQNLLLPDAGEQTVSFVPLAQKAMTAALKASSASALTLPLTLRFHSDTGASLEMTDRALSGHYTVAPLGDPPVTLRLGGRAAPLVLRAPPGLSARDATASLTARLLGRALNAGSAPAPLSLPGRGLRVATDRMVAARVPVAPRGDPAAPVPLASIALRVTATEAAELALELRADAAGRPGAILAPPVVRQLDAGFGDWLDLVLPAPLPVAAGAPVWATLRLTKGTLLWHAGGSPAQAGSAFVSIDKGASWGDAASALQDPAPLLVQAFHLVDPPFPAPVIALRSGASVLLADWFAGGAASGQKEFRLAVAPVPADALRLLTSAAPAAGQVRAETRLLLYSDAVLDLVVAGMTIAYDPGGARGG